MTSNGTGYKMSLTTGGLFINDSVDIARIYLTNRSWQKTIKLAIEQNIPALPKIASQTRTAREITNRLENLSERELIFLVEEADRLEQAALLWLGACRTYRLVREFAIEVLRDRYLSFQLDVPLDSFDRLYEAKAEWNEDLSRISRTTFLKLRQIVFRIMREAGIINENNRILPSYISPKLRNLITETNIGDLALFPGVTSE